MEANTTPLAGTFTGLIDEIITQLKTIPELADDAEGTRVFKWEGRHKPIPDRYDIEVKAGPVTTQGLSGHSVVVEYDVICDLIYWGSITNVEDSFDNAMGVAEKVYDQFNLTTINDLVFKALVELAPGDGELSSKTMLAIPIRIIIRCEKNVRR